MYTKFTISVKKIDFDPGASELHLSGQIVRENSFAKLGQHQTLHLKVSDQFTLEKTEGWDSVSLETLRELIDPRKRADKSNVIAAVVMQEGLANICAITEHRTVLKQRVSTAIPKKRGGSGSAHDEVLLLFINFLECLRRFGLQVLDVRLTAPASQQILRSNAHFTAPTCESGIRAAHLVSITGIYGFRILVICALGQVC